jgi:hypothetical protein
VIRARATFFVLLLAVVSGELTAGSAISSGPAGLPGLMVGKGPWGPNDGQNLRQRLKAIGLHALPREGLTLHNHAHLDIVVGKRQFGVPPLIGINVAQRFITELHTHDQSGIIHVESPTVRTFTLGEFFDVWGLRFSSRCLGGNCVNSKNELRVWANGKRIRTDPRKIVLRGYQEIVVIYGAPAFIRKLRIPATYPFPKGY